MAGIAKKIKKGMHNFFQYIQRGGVTYLTVAALAPDGQLAGKTALITGGGSGIGREIAKAFLTQGAKVVIVGRHIEKLQAVADACNSENLYIVQGDVADISAQEHMLSACFAAVGENIDILVNNAGVLTRANFFNMNEAEWDRVMDTNLKGLYFLSQKFICRALQAKTEAKIINISSNHAFIGDDGPYGLSKRALNAMTQGLARKYGQQGIVVNAIAPGGVASDIHGVDTVDNLYFPLNAHGRLIAPEEVAELALFLAGERSKSIIGQTIVIDGGSTL